MNKLQSDSFKRIVDHAKMPVAWLLIAGFYLIIYYSKAEARLTKLYYDMAGIPYWTQQDKFHPYYVRKDNK